LEVIMTDPAVLIPARQGCAGSLRFEPPVSRPGDLVRFRAETDLVVIMSACPQDLTPVNGTAQRPVGVHFQVHDDG
jgi:uncharacterized protein